jgi:hypothetical protein
MDGNCSKFCPNASFDILGAEPMKFTMSTNEDMPKSETSKHAYSLRP